MEIFNNINRIYRFYTTLGDKVLPGFSPFSGETEKAKYLRRVLALYKGKPAIFVDPKTSFNRVLGVLEGIKEINQKTFLLQVKQLLGTSSHTSFSLEFSSREMTFRVFLLSESQASSIQEILEYEPPKPLLMRIHTGDDDLPEKLKARGFKVPKNLRDLQYLDLLGYGVYVDQKGSQVSENEVSFGHYRVIK